MDIALCKRDPNEKLVPVDIQKEMEKSFIDYSMSVIVARALPDVRDGLKPVHRRIMYTMHEIGLTYDKKHRKCADTVGQTLGSYHPHGDSSVYDALVRLAQPFSLRYPLIDGQGNFGSVNGEHAAAYRYTEARMQKLSEELLRDIDKDTVDFQPNYDDRKQEPTVLPAKFPNLLVNGSVGIAVGMATNIPPHNLGEVCDALQLLLKNPDADTSEITRCIQGPDFPTAGIIMGRAGINAAYLTGRGKITLRGRAEIEEVQGEKQIVITEIPYMIKKGDLVDRIEDLIREKKIEARARYDQSDLDGMRIIVKLKKEANPDIVLNQLYSFTQLQETVGIILLALVDGQPKILTLKEILEHYIEFQNEIITSKTNFELKKARTRAHILEGLVLTADNIDEVIRILRASANIPECKQNLRERFTDTEISPLLERAMTAYAATVEDTAKAVDLQSLEYPSYRGLSEEQADAVVQMRFGQLTGLERDKLTAELADLMYKIREYVEILSDKAKVTAIISKELDEIKRRYGDERRTAIEDTAGDVVFEDLVPIEECVVTYTDIGYIKRQPAEEYNIQRRGGRGVSGMKQRDEDFVRDLQIAGSRDNLLFVSNKGNMFRLKCYEIPAGGRQSRGAFINSLLQLSEGERIQAIMSTGTFAPTKFFVCVTKKGIIKRTSLGEFPKKRSGVPMRAIILSDDDEIASAHLTEGDSSVIIATRGGYAVHYDESRVRASGRVTRSMRAIRLHDGDEVVGVAKIFRDDCTLLTVTENGFGRRTPISAYPKKHRGGRGVINYKVDAERGNVLGIATLFADDDVIVGSDRGIIIRFRANDMQVIHRTGRGVRIMRLEDDSKVAAFSRTEHDDEEVTEVLEFVPEEVVADAESEAETDESDESEEEEPETDEDEDLDADDTAEESEESEE